jgi:sulfotransferase family protein
MRLAVARGTFVAEALVRESYASHAKIPYNNQVTRQLSEQSCMAGASRWKSIVRPLWNRVRSASIIDGGADAKQTVFLSSGARTGSTWVAEIINFENDYRFLFEPFSMVAPLRPSWAPRLLPDDRLRYIRPECEDRDLVEQAARVVSGRFRDPEVDQYNYNARIVFDRRLVKETKSNLYLKWLHRRFPQMKLLLLMRHPIPTVLSRMHAIPEIDRARRNAEYRSLMFGQPELVEDHLAPFREVLESANTEVEQRLAVWCVQNFVPLRQFAAGDVHIMFYETLCVDPESELRRLSAYLGEELGDAKLGRALRRLRRPSSTIHRDVKAFPDGWDVVSRWQSEATADDVASAKRLLGAFGLDAIYGDGPMPNVDAPLSLMKPERSAVAR